MSKKALARRFLFHEGSTVVFLGGTSDSISEWIGRLALYSTGLARVVGGGGGRGVSVSN